MRKIKLLSLIFLYSQMAVSQSSSPDHRWESRLNQIYQEIKDRKLTEEQWQAMLEGKDQDSYRIQVGDNLWDVSKTIFGSGFFWPKLWQLNSKITNPHDLNIGYELKFVDLGMDGPTVIGGGDDKEVAKPELTQADKLTLSEDEILELSWREPEIPPAKSVRPALRELPPSLFDWRQTDYTINEDSSSIEVRAAQILQKKKYLVENFISTQKPKGVGTIHSFVTSQANSAATYDYVYITIPQAGVGDEFIAINSEELVEKEVNGKDIEYYSVEVQAKIKIVETLDIAKSIHKALVLKSLKALTLASVLIPGDLPESTWVETGEYLNIKADILGGRFDSHRQLFGLGSVVYLNKGTKDGIVKEAIMDILRNPSARGNTLDFQDFPAIGRLKIVDVQDSVSTALVVSSKDEILEGDITGAPISLQLGQ